MTNTRSRVLAVLTAITFVSAAIVVAAPNPNPPGGAGRSAEAAQKKPPKKIFVYAFDGAGGLLLALNPLKHPEKQAVEAGADKIASSVTVNGNLVNMNCNFGTNRTGLLTLS